MNNNLDNSVRELLSRNVLIWSVYLDNYLKSKYHEKINSDLLYLPIEREKGKINFNKLDEKEKFFFQMYNLLSKLNFEINNKTIICISCTTSYHYLSSRLIVDFFKKFYPKSILIMGGIHTACLDDFKSPIDYVIRGEGEQSLYNLIKNGVKKQENPIVIESIPISNINDLPPIDFSIFEKYAQSIYQYNINLSRGCPYNCNFCMEKNLNQNYLKRWRSYSPKRAIQEINNLIKFIIPHGRESINLTINDPIFGLNRKWLNGFLSLYNFDIDSVWIESRVDILNEGILNKFRKNNFFQMYGLESCSKKILEIMNKTNNPNKYLKNFEKIFEIHSKLNYLCIVNLIFNHPGETKETIKESLERFKKIITNSRMTNFILAQYLYSHNPNTEVYNNFKVYQENYGSFSFFPEWWKDDCIGAYCIKPSHNLPLEQSLDLFLNFYKEIGNYQQMKKNFIFDIMRIKSIKKKILNLMKKHNLPQFCQL